MQCIADRMTTYIQGIPFDTHGRYVDQNSVDFRNHSDQQFILQLLREHLAMHVRIQMNAPTIKTVETLYGGVYREGTILVHWENAEDGMYYKFDLPSMTFKLGHGGAYVLQFRDEWFSRE